MWALVVCVGDVGGGKKEGGREEATDIIEHLNSHKQYFFSGLARHFHSIKKVLTHCLSYRHCHDSLNALQNHTFRKYFLAVSLGGCRVPWN